MSADEILIAQISDPHIGADYAVGDDDNLTRLETVLSRLATMPRRPDVLLVTGDLAGEEGEAPYRWLKDRLERCPFPYHVILGNHDTRYNARRIFGGGEESFRHYAFDVGPLRVVMLDTLEEGRHGGAFCEARADWLKKTLEQEPARPTIVALHHPPIDTGIDWLTTAPDEPWVTRLDAALAGHGQIVALLAGHVHRAISAMRNGIPVRVCPAVSATATLDLVALDPRKPDGRALVSDGPPGFALHLWRNASLVSHVEYVTEQPVILRFDHDSQPLVEAVFAERP